MNNPTANWAAIADHANAYREAIGTLNNSDRSFLMSPTHGIIVAHHKDGLRMHAWKVWEFRGGSGNPLRLLAQADSQETANGFAHAIISALNHAWTR